MTLSLKQLQTNASKLKESPWLKSKHKPSPEKVTRDGKSFVDIQWEEGSFVRAGYLEDKRFKPVSRRSLNVMGKLKPEWEDFICEVLGLNKFDLEQDMRFIKDRLQLYTKLLGCRPTKFVEMWNACHCKAFIPQEVSHVAKEYCRGLRGRYVNHYLTNLSERKEQIKQLEDDDMWNVVPFFLYNNKEITVREFRKQVGKGVWKALLKNSKSRNVLIARCFYNQNYFYDSVEIKYLNSLPTGLIPSNCLTASVPTEEEATLFKRMRVISDKKKQRRSLTIVRDTKRMSEDLGYTKLPKGHTKWTFSQWEAHHTHLTELINAKKYSKDVFPWTNTLEKKQWEFGEFSAKLLDNAFDIKMEGESMGHCVASYSRRVMNKKYIVVGMLDAKGKRHSTLGLYLSEEQGVQFNQHYMKHNASVTSKVATQFANIIVEDLNKQLKFK